MKKTVILPHPILLLGGRLLCLLAITLLCAFWFQLLFNFSKMGLIGLFSTLFLSICFGFFAKFVWHQIWGKLVITDSYVKYCGFLLSSVKLFLIDIDFVEIRTFDQGNVMYGKNPAIDAYTFLLLSKSRVSNVRIDKIRSSERKKIIKFAVSEKLCKVLVEKLPSEKVKPIEYMLFLYNRAKH